MQNVKKYKVAREALLILLNGRNPAEISMLEEKEKRSGEMINKLEVAFRDCVVNTFEEYIKSVYQKTVEIRTETVPRVVDKVEGVSRIMPEEIYMKPAPKKIQEPSFDDKEGDFDTFDNGGKLQAFARIERPPVKADPRTDIFGKKVKQEVDDIPTIVVPDVKPSNQGPEGPATSISTPRDEIKKIDVPVLTDKMQKRPSQSKVDEPIVVLRQPSGPVAQTPREVIQPAPLPAFEGPPPFENPAPQKDNFWGDVSIPDATNTENAGDNKTTNQNSVANSDFFNFQDQFSKPKTTPEVPQKTVDKEIPEKKVDTPIVVESPPNQTPPLTRQASKGENTAQIFTEQPPAPSTSIEDARKAAFALEFGQPAPASFKKKTQKQEVKATTAAAFFDNPPPTKKTVAAPTANFDPFGESSQTTATNNATSGVDWNDFVSKPVETNQSVSNRSIPHSARSINQQATPIPQLNIQEVTKSNQPHPQPFDFFGQAQTAQPANTNFDWNHVSFAPTPAPTVNVINPQPEIIAVPIVVSQPAVQNIAQQQNQPEVVPILPTAAPVLPAPTQPPAVPVQLPPVAQLNPDPFFGVIPSTINTTPVQPPALLVAPLTTTGQTHNKLEESSVVREAVDFGDFDNLSHSQLTQRQINEHEASLVNENSLVFQDPLPLTPKQEAQIFGNQPAFEVSTNPAEKQKPLVSSNQELPGVQNKNPNSGNSQVKIAETGGSGISLGQVQPTTVMQTDQNSRDVATGSQQKKPAAFNLSDFDDLFPQQPTSTQQVSNAAANNIVNTQQSTNVLIGETTQQTKTIFEMQGEVKPHILVTPSMDNLPVIPLQSPKPAHKIVAEDFPETSQLSMSNFPQIDDIPNFASPQVPSIKDAKSPTSPPMAPGGSILHELNLTQNPAPQQQVTPQPFNIAQPQQLNDNTANQTTVKVDAPKLPVNNQQSFVSMEVDLLSDVSPHPHLFKNNNPAVVNQENQKQIAFNFISQQPHPVSQPLPEGASKPVANINTSFVDPFEQHSVMYDLSVSRADHHDSHIAPSTPNQATQPQQQQQPQPLPKPAADQANPFF